VWYQSKYIKAAGVAFATGLISAIILYLGIIDDPTMTARQVIKITGLAFMSPFATLVRFLPSFQDVLGNGATVNAENVERMTVNNPPAAPVASDVPTPKVMPRSTK